MEKLRTKLKNCTNKKCVHFNLTFYVQISERWVYKVKMNPKFAEIKFSLFIYLIHSYFIFSLVNDEYKTFEGENIP